MTSNFQQARSIFLALLGTPADQWDSYLDQACGTDQALREQVELVVRAHKSGGGLLDQASPPAILTIAQPGGERPGTVIAGRYKLLEAIGQGGMGAVWVAEQTEPVRRKVALKLIKAGMDSRSVVARFEAERQALAVMDHPNIAKVLDGGLTEAGRPYFVMEYVKGVPITDYCDAARLNVAQRLDLFAQVCQAVQHAHHKGIIHRDLKPSNILVAPYDDKPVPKVIDFGLAKAMHQPLTDRTLHTAHETVLGTPLYMSPEQAQLNNLDVDTRSDIYSLGVLLYELLTGTTPLEKQRFKEAAWDEIRRVIREEEAPRPSTRLSSSNTLASLAAGRQIEPARLTKMVRGELDWIVMKALEKERNRRYETANGLAMDVQRYLSGEPVLAAPPSVRYRTGKFARKHRAALSAAAVITLLLVAGVAVSTLQAVRATRAEGAARVAQRAETARAEGERLAKLDAQAQKAIAEGAAAAERTANEQAQKRLTQIQKANHILGSIFENLDPNEIAKAQRPLQAILVEKLDQAVEQLQEESIGDPLVVATMQQTFGESLMALGEPKKAIVLLEKARATRQDMLGPDHPDVLTSMDKLAWAYQDAGKLDLALPLYENTLKARKTKLGLDHPNTLYSMNNLAVAYQAAGKLDLAVPLFEQAVKLLTAKLGPDDRETITSMGNLANAYEAAGKLDLAVPLSEQAFKLFKAKLGPDHPDTLNSLDNLASRYRTAGKLDLAVPLFEQALKLRTAKLGPDHPATLDTMAGLARAYEAAGKLDLALPLYEQTLKLRRAKLGPDHPDTLASMDNLSEAYLDVGKLDLALALNLETLKLKTAEFGPDHPETLASMNNLANKYRAADKLDLAVPLFEQTLKLMTAKFGPDHPTTLTCMNNLALAYQDAGKPDLALPLYEKSLKLMTAKLGPDHPTTLAIMCNLAEAYQAAGKLDLAVSLQEQTLKLRQAKLGLDHPDTMQSMNNLAAAYRAAGKQNLALPLFEETLKLRKAKLGADHPKTLESMHNLAAGYESAGKKDLALPLFEETLRVQKSKLGPDHADTLSTMDSLGWMYANAGKLDLARAIYEEWLKLMKAKVGPDHPETLSRIAHVGHSLLQSKAFAKAEPLLRECLAAREKTRPDDWTTFNTRSMLGGALLGQEKYADAEPLLLSGYEGMVQREAEILPDAKIRPIEALQRLIKLYESRGGVGDVEKAKTYRDLLDQRKTAKNEPGEDTRWRSSSGVLPAGWAVLHALSP